MARHIVTADKVQDQQRWEELSKDLSEGEVSVKEHPELSKAFWDKWYDLAAWLADRGIGWVKKNGLYFLADSLTDVDLPPGGFKSLDEMYSWVLDNKAELDKKYEERVKVDYPTYNEKNLGSLRVSVKLKPIEMKELQEEIKEERDEEEPILKLGPNGTPPGGGPMTDVDRRNFKDHSPAYLEKIAPYFQDAQMGRARINSVGVRVVGD